MSKVFAEEDRLVTMHHRAGMLLVSSVEKFTATSVTACVLP